MVNDLTTMGMTLTLLDSVAIGFWVTEGLQVDLVGLFDFASCSMTDEDGLSSPLLKDKQGEEEAIQCQ